MQSSYRANITELRYLEKLFRHDAAPDDRSRELKEAARRDMERLVSQTNATAIYRDLPRAPEVIPDPYSLRHDKRWMDWTNAPIQVYIFSKARSMFSTLGAYSKPYQFVYGFTGQKFRRDVSSITTVASVSTINAELFERFESAYMNSSEARQYVGNPLGAHMETRLLLNDTVVIDEHVNVLVTVQKRARLHNIWCCSAVPADMRPRGTSAIGRRLFLVLQKVPDTQFLTEDRERVSEQDSRRRVEEFRNLLQQKPTAAEVNVKVSEIMGLTPAVSVPATATVVNGKPLDPPAKHTRAQESHADTKHVPTNSRRQRKPVPIPVSKAPMAKAGVTFAAASTRKRSRHEIEDAKQARRVLTGVGKATSELKMAENVLLKHQFKPLTGAVALTATAAVAAGRQTDVSIAGPVLQSYHDESNDPRKTKKRRVLSNITHTGVMVRKRRPGNMIWQIVPYVTFGEVPIIADAAANGYRPEIVSVGTVAGCDAHLTDPALVDQFVFPKDTEWFNAVTYLDGIDVLLDVRVVS